VTGEIWKFDTQLKHLVYLETQLVTLLEFDTVCVNYLDSHFLSPSPTELTKMPLCVWDLDVEIIFNLHLKLKCDVQVGCGGGQEQRRRRGAGAGAAQAERTEDGDTKER
jgi:hypothetical protein